VVLVLTEGRPRTFPEVALSVDAIVYAGLPGYYGADVIAEVLAGDVNPSGKLSFTYPYHQSFQLSYDHKPTSFTYLHENNEETEKYFIGEFGEGMSYTTFEYDHLVLTKDTLTGPYDKVTATVRVTNTGDRKGKESVLWFIRDEYGKITRPVRKLRYFEKELIKPGETKIFEFEIDPLRDLSYPDSKGERLVEPGAFTLMVGDCKTDLFYSE
jgi:beta-glucosidase